MTSLHNSPHRVHHCDSNSDAEIKQAMQGCASIDCKRGPTLVKSVYTNLDTAQLIDEIRELEAKAAGKRIELCIRIGDRDGAVRAQQDMYALIEARRAARYARAEDQGEPFFMAAGRIDGELTGGVSSA